MSTKKPKAAPPSMTEAVRAQLREILDRPDLDARALMELEQTARLTRELLAVGKDPRVLNRVNVNYGSNYIADGGYAQMTALTSYDTTESSSPLAPAPKAETFGATVLRELMALRGSREEGSPVEAIKAIALAKEKGLDKLAAKLEAQLLGEPEEKPKSLAQATNGHAEAHS